MIRKKIYCHNLPLLSFSKVSEDKEKNLDYIYQTIVRNMSSFVPKDSTIVVENIDDSFQNYMLLQCLSVISVFCSAEVYIEKKPFSKFPKYIKSFNSNFNIISTKKKEEIVDSKTIIFSPFMYHNVLDKKFNDSLYTKITYYPFLKIGLEDLIEIGDCIFERPATADLVFAREIYADIRCERLSKEIVQIHKEICKSTTSFRFVIVNKNPDEDFYKFLGSNSNIIPLYTENVTEFDNRFIGFSSQEYRGITFSLDEKEVIDFANLLFQYQRNTICGYYGEFSNPINQIIKLHLNLYSIEREVQAYGNI